MKTKLLFIALFSISLISNAQQAVNLSMSADYANEVFYDFSENESYSYTAADWDVAFLRTSAYAFATRINDGAGIELFEVSTTPSDYATVDIANEANWTQLYNSDTDWMLGAFDQGTASYGWGEYNPTTHVVEGTTTFVLKYEDGTYRKFFIEDFYSGYTFKYSTWDATNQTWSTDVTETVANTSNPNRIFNYYNLADEAEVMAEPEATAWDLKFTRFTTDYPYNGTTMKYTVTGVLHHPDVTVAENTENGAGDPNAQTYMTEINTIGYDWKVLNASYQYDIVSDMYYYVKDVDNNVYRLHFTSFEGSSTGNLSFNAEDVTSQLSVTNFDNGDSFGFYPNPAQGQIEILYENQISTDVNVAIYNMTGQKVLEKELKNDGFYNQKLDISHLNTGNYVIKFSTGNQSTTKKLIVQ